MERNLILPNIFGMVHISGFLPRPQIPQVIGVIKELTAKLSDKRRLY